MMIGTQDTDGENRHDSFHEVFANMPEASRDLLMELPKLDLAEDIWNMARAYFQPSPEPWSEEEFKTYLGQMTVDLVESWGTHKQPQLEPMLNAAESIDDESYSMRQLRAALTIDSQTVGKPDCYFDGRGYTGCHLYGYASEEGATQRVTDVLKRDLACPEHSEICKGV